MPPPYGITASGFESKPQDAIESEMVDFIHGNVSTALNLTETSSLGQLLQAFAGQLTQVWEAMADTYANWDPNQAIGQALANIGFWTGATYLGIEYSTVDMTVTLTAGTYAAGVLRVNLDTDATVVFTNDGEITTAGATLSDIPFTAINPGPISAPAGHLTVITSPISGFSNPVNPAAADEGRFAETAAEFRLRRRALLARRGSTSVNAIRAALLDPANVPGVDYVSVLENDTDATVGVMTPHSIRAIVLGGSPEDIRTTLFNAKAGGITTIGAQSGAVVDTAGNSHIVRYDIPTDVGVNLQIFFTWITGSFISNAAAESAVTAAVTAAIPLYQGVGKDVIGSKYVRALAPVEGISDAYVLMAFAPGVPAVAASLPIGAAERAVISLAVVGSEVPADP